MSGSEWRDIESAPKESPVPLVDLWIADGGPGYRLTDCYWSIIDERWDQIGSAGKPRFTGEPTHWMPLPGPPSQA